MRRETHRRSRGIATGALLLACLAAALPSMAATLTWDTVVDGPPVTHGNGTWDLGSNRWNSSGANVTWSNSPVNDALFIGGASGATITLGNEPIIAGTITFSGPGNTILQGPLANLSAAEIKIDTISDGKLVMNAPGSGTLSQVAKLSISSGATLYLSNGVIVTGGITAAGTGNNEARGALRLDGNAKLLGNVSLTGNTSFGSSSGTGTIAGPVSGAFSFQQAATSPGTICLGGDNSFSGGSIISNGTVQAGHDHAFGSGTLTLSGGILSSDSTVARTLPNACAIAGPVTLGSTANSGRLSFAGTVSFSGNQTLTTDSEVEFSTINGGGQLNHAGNGALTLGGSFTAMNSSAGLGGPIRLGAPGLTIDTKNFDITIPASFEGSGGLTKTGSGILTLNGVSTATGPVLVSTGTLRLSPSTGLPAGLEIMPLGDSITYGYGGRHGYRSYLHAKLVPLAPGFRFIGDSVEQPLNPPGLPANQLSHAGHSSYSTFDIQNNLDGFDSATFQQYGGAERNPHGGYWLSGGHGTGRAAIFPDAILLLAGTNDVGRLDMAGAESRYRALLTKITTLRPDAHVFAAKITPWSENSSKVSQFNQIITRLAAEFKTAGKKVTLVDLNAGYAGGFVDGVHPNESGYQWMADRWQAALIATLGIPAQADLGHASSLTISPGAAIEGSGRTGTTIISGTYRNTLGPTGSGLLEVSGDLTLDGATLSLSAALQPGQSSYEILRYTGDLSGSFTTTTGMPSGYRLVHLEEAKKIYIATAYEEWRLKSGIDEAHKSPENDPDQDGRSNLLEFALGGKPLDPADRGVLSASRTDSTGECRFVITTLAGANFANGPDHGMTTNAGGASYRVEASPDLLDWSSPVSEIALSPQDMEEPAPEGYEYHAFTAEGTGRIFFRLKASQSP